MDFAFHFKVFFCNAHFSYYYYIRKNKYGKSSDFKEESEKGEEGPWVKHVHTFKGW